MELKLTAAENHDQSIIDVIPMPILIYDAEGEFVTFNKAFGIKFGLREKTSEARRHNIKNFNELNIETFCGKGKAENDNIIFNNGQYEFLQKYVDECGNLHWFEVIQKNISLNSGREGTFCIFNDITARKAAEDKLMETLKKEIEINRMKNQFISTISHEFKTPLSIILSSCELVDYYHDKLTRAESLECNNKIKAAVKRMNSMIGNLLLISKTEKYQFEMISQNADIKSFCEKIIYETKISTNKNGVINFNLHKDSSPTAKFDPKILKHAILNILSNAVKYCIEEYHINFEVRSDKNHIIFTVQDHGIGIPEKNIDNIFNAFFRGDNTEKIPGNGLGLSIAKKFVELHKGTIHVKSELGKGTVFQIKIPANDNSTCNVKAETL